jgi:hypothetical protein
MVELHTDELGKFQLSVRLIFGRLIFGAQEREPTVWLTARGL